MCAEKNAHVPLGLHRFASFACGERSVPAEMGKSRASDTAVLAPSGHFGRRYRQLYCVRLHDSMQTVRSRCEG